MLRDATRGLVWREALRRGFYEGSVEDTLFQRVAGDKRAPWGVLGQESVRAGARTEEISGELSNVRVRNDSKDRVLRIDGRSPARHQPGTP